MFLEDRGSNGHAVGDGRAEAVVEQDRYADGRGRGGKSGAGEKQHQQAYGN